MKRSDIESMPAGEAMDELVARHVTFVEVSWDHAIFNTARSFDTGPHVGYAARYESCMDCGEKWPASQRPRPRCKAPRYSTDLVQAHGVLDAMHKRGYAWTAKRYRPGVFILPGDDAGPAYRMSIYNETATHDGYADSLAHAVCRAALIAVLDLEPEQESAP